MPIHDYPDVDATTLAERVRRREVEPSELVEEAIAAIGSVNPRLNALVHDMFDRARLAARGTLAEGPFSGVPFVVKDLDGFLAGAPYSQGCRMTARFVPDHDATVVARMKRTGVIIVGKTNTPELGLLGVTEPLLFGPTRNPWNLGHTPGGSSGGTAALVAARAIPMGHGGDGGGSIRIPAANCGIFGLKPTRGRNPTGPDVGEGWGGYVQQGVLTRSVRDCAAMLDATQGFEPGAPYASPPRARPYLEEIATPPRRLRIALSTKSQLGRRVHADCVAAVLDAAELCRSLGHDVVEAEPPIDRDALVEAYFTQIAVGASSAIDMCSRLVGRAPTPDDFEAETWLLGQIGRKLTALDLQRSRDACQAATRTLARFFERHDLFLNATLTYPPMTIGQLALGAGQRAALAVLRVVSPKPLLDRVLSALGSDALERSPNTQVANQSGHPAMSVPLFWAPSGLPIGAQFLAPFGDEATLFQLAAQLEVARPWAGKKPSVCATARG